MTDRELLELIAEKVVGMDGELKGLSKRVDSVDQHIDNVEKQLIHMENEFNDKTSALFDARDVQNNANQQILESLKRIESKLDAQDAEIFMLKKVK